MQKFMFSSLPQVPNRTLAQILLFAVILLLLIVSIWGLGYFIPGFLGALTLYVVFRNKYELLTKKYGWKPWVTSLFFILASIVLIVVPLWLLGDYMVGQLQDILGNRALLEQKLQQVQNYIQSQPYLKTIDVSKEKLVGYLQKVAMYLPGILGAAGALLTNLAVTFFVLYFMQTGSERMERMIKVILPFSARSKKELWDDTYMMIRSNAIGIPVLGFFQGIVAMIGYFLFGVDNAVLWGLVTGAATIIPVIGTMVVWVPICIIEMASGNSQGAIWLALYSLVVVGGIDNILRFTILKKLGDVHPLITVFGVLLGLQVMGVMGLVFGPLLMSSIGSLFKVYRSEYGVKRARLAQAGLTHKLPLTKDEEEQAKDLNEESPHSGK
jgi:predicted PurR-regulated permease PerM